MDVGERIEVRKVYVWRASLFGLVYGLFAGIIIAIIFVLLLVAGMNQINKTIDSIASASSSFGGESEFGQATTVNSLDMNTILMFALVLIIISAIGGFLSGLIGGALFNLLAHMGIRNHVGLIEYAKVKEAQFKKEESKPKSADDWNNQRLSDPKNDIVSVKNRYL